VHVHPQGGERNVGAKLTGKSCKCTPRQSVHPLGRTKVCNFKEIGEIWTVRVVNLLVITCVLNATTKKVVNFFGRRKVHPRENPGYARVYQLGAEFGEYWGTLELRIGGSC